MAILVYYLDDEEALCEIFNDTFSSAEVSVEVFTDPIALLNRAKAVPPNIFFLDNRLPNTNGEELAQKLDPAIPKVLVTGDIAAPKSKSFLKVLHKPIEIADVEAILNTLAARAPKPL